jgi:Flp pilus assembly protein TadG
LLTRSLWLKFLRERRSDTAVEFALIGSVLFLFLFGIMLMGLVQFWQMVLDDSVRGAARQVQSFRVSTAPGFTSAVCGEFGLAAPNCANSLHFDVQQAPLFANITPDTVSTLNNSAGFPVLLKPAHALLFQVVYQVPITLPLLPFGFVTGNGTNRLISATALMVQ